MYHPVYILGQTRSNAPYSPRGRNEQLLSRSAYYARRVRGRWSRLYSFVFGLAVREDEDSIAELGIVRDGSKSFLPTFGTFDLVPGAALWVPSF